MMTWALMTTEAFLKAMRGSNSTRSRRKNCRRSKSL